MNIPYQKQYKDGILIPMTSYPTLMPNRRSRRNTKVRTHGESSNYHLNIVGGKAFHVVRQLIALKDGGTKTVTHYIAQ